MEKFYNLDADQSVFFARELEFIQSQSYDIKYPSLNAMSVLPVTNEAGAGADSIVFEQYDSSGIAKFVADYADDVPRADVKGKQYSVVVQSLASGYGYSVQEIRAAQLARKNLTNMRAMAARKSIDQMANKIGWFADGTAAWAGTTGILYHPNVSKSAATTGAWQTGPKTPDQIIADVNNGINKIFTDTLGIHKCNFVGLPLSEYSYIATTPRSSYSDTTILEFLKMVNPGVVFAPIHELASVNPNPRTAGGATNIMFCAELSPEVLKYHMPVIFEQFAPQPKGLSWVVPCHSRNAGVEVHYPLAVHIVDGL